MKRKFLSLSICLAMAASLLVSTSLNVKAADTTPTLYNGTAINSNLNATTTPDHIVLTWAGDPSTTQAITWRTSSAVTSGKVQYRKQGDTTFSSATATKSSFSATISSGTGNMNLFTVNLTALQPGITYEYKVGDGTIFSAISTFKTQPSNNNSAKFLVFGDSQSGVATNPEYTPWHDTIQKAYSENPDANFSINLGDLVEIGQDYTHWNNWFAAASGVIDHIPEMPVQGNHETYQSSNYDSGKPQDFISQFAVSNNGPSGYNGQVYSYNYGDVHFVVLDSQEDEEAPKNDGFLQAEADWLEKDLSANKQKWTIVMFHKTPYYNKKTRNNPSVKDILTPVIEKHHVDIVLNGHDHGLSRTYPINRDTYYTDYSKGTVYYVTGRSGNKYYTDLNSKIWDASFIDCQDSPCYEVFNVVGGKLTVNAYKYSTVNAAYANPTLVDTLVIDKDNPSDSTKLTLPKSATTQLAVAGTLIKDYAVDVVNNKAYVDPQKIADYYGGTYDKINFILNVNKVDYKFTTADLLNGDPSKVNLDTLYKDGIDCKYNSDLNTVLVDFTGRVDATNFKGFTIGDVPPASNPAGNNSGSSTPSSNSGSNTTSSDKGSNTASSSSGTKLPQTGSAIDTEVLIVMGICLLVVGFIIVKKAKLSDIK